MTRGVAESPESEFHNTLLGLMWRSTEYGREADAKVATRLTIYIALASTILGASFGGFFTYWYSHEGEQSSLVAGLWLLLAGIAFILTVVFVPRAVDSFRTRMEKKSTYDAIKDAYDSGLLDRLLKLDSNTPRPPFPARSHLESELTVVDGEAPSPHSESGE